MVNGVDVGPHNTRMETIDFGNGTHHLIIKKCQNTDAGRVFARTPTGIGNGTEESESYLNVLPPEKKPTIGVVHPVTCYVSNKCEIVIPYSVNGTRQSNVDLKVERDGSLLHVETYFKLTKTVTKFVLVIRHAAVEKSGNFTFVLSNLKGPSEAKSIIVKIRDKPSPPVNVRVENIFHDNVVVKWNAPLRTGGSNITKYIIEVCYSHLLKSSSFYIKISGFIF